MFVHGWPVWANFVILALILVAKWLLIKWVEKSPFYTTKMVGKTWLATAAVVAGLNAIVTFLLLFMFVGTGWALVLGLIDGAVHWLVTYYQRKKKLPTISLSNAAVATTWWTDIKSWFSALPLTTELSIAGWVTTFGLGHSTSISSLFSAILAYFQAKA